MTKVLAIADEVHEALYGDLLDEISPDLIVSSGDLPFDYLDNLISRSDRPLVYVLGNHDPGPDEPPAPQARLLPDRQSARPAGGLNADGRIVSAAGLRVAGLGGSLRYKPGPNQFSERQMLLRALRLEARAGLAKKLGRGGVDILLTHAAPLGLGDADDLAHRGFAVFRRLIEHLHPRLLIHGHVHRGAPGQRDLSLGETQIVNAVPYRVLEV